ncbi:glycosyltransferase [Algoriphagus namhaensis]
MRILFLDTEPIRRGAQIFISELSLFLSQKGNDCKVIYLYQMEDSKEVEIFSAELSKVLEGDKNHFFEKIPGVNPRLLRKLLLEINGFRPDIILANGSRTLKYAAAARQFYSVKTTWIARWIDDASFWNPGMVSKWVYRKLILSQFDATIGVSQTSLDSMIRHYDFKKPSRVIHRAFDPKKFENAPSKAAARRELGLDDEDEVLLLLGNLTSQKRPDRFLEIIQKLAKTRPHLKGLIVGDGPLRLELEEQVFSPDSYRDKYQVSRGKNLEKRGKNQEERDKNQDTRVEDSSEPSLPSQTGLPSSVRSNPAPESIHGAFSIGHQTSDTIQFLGYQKDVSPYLAAADLLILTSDTEGLPGVVLEAAFFKVPCVATDVGGIRECLVDGTTGRINSDLSVRTHSELIERLLDHPANLKQMGDQAYSFVNTKFDFERISAEYLSFFQDLLASDRTA